MKWKPISETGICNRIQAAEGRMSTLQRRFWKSIRIQPEKWEQHPEGDYGNGFWIVALIDRTVIWYNDIEDGFNLSHYSHYGVIGDYRCNQNELELVVQDLLPSMETENNI